MGELIEGIVSTHEMFVSDSGLTLDYHAEDNVLVVGDPDMIRQATANLISNAVRYTPGGRAYRCDRSPWRHHGIDSGAGHRHRPHA